MRKILSLAAAFSILSVIGMSATTTPAQARKSCWVDHYHYGSGSGKTKRSAKKAAIASWQSFTAWEYGAKWGKFRLAKDKRVSCSGSRGSYSCQASGIPCYRKR